MKRVAVIGAGAAGLTAAKACKEDGIDFVIFEKTGKATGLWNFKESEGDEVASVMKTTVINSSKEMSAFSDFPPPKDFPNYMHHSLMCKYIFSYAEKFGLLDSIRYNQEVTKLFPAKDYDKTGRWILTAKNARDKTVTQEIFDGVMVCTGHHCYPHIPKFQGQEDFKGKIIHTHSLKVPDAFKDQNVVVVGVGNSGLDAAVEISNVAKQVYLSTRRGTWIMFKLGLCGLPADGQLLTRANNFLSNIIGFNLTNFFLEFYMNTKFNHELYNLRPKHRFLSQHLSINDHLPNKVLSGIIVVKSDIKSFTDKGVIFHGEEEFTQIDSVVLGTGYKIKYPFISDKILDTTGNKVDLYKFMFPPNLKHPSLAIIGLIQPAGSLLPIFEMQSRLYTHLLNGKVKLPDQKTMVEDIQKRKNEVLSRYVATQRHTVQIDFIPYMDEIAAEIGAKPNLLKMAVTDPVLLYHCVLGPCTPYQYRLQGPHPWPEARHTILTTKERITLPLETRHDIKHGNSTKSIRKYAFIFFHNVMCFIGLSNRRHTHG